MFNHIAVKLSLLAIALLLFASLPYSQASVASDEVATAGRLYSTGQFDQAKDKVSKALASDPQSYDAVLLLGRIALLDNHLDAAKTLLTEAINLRPEAPKPKLLLAEVYRRLDDFADAAPLYTAAGNTSRAAFMQMLKGQFAYQVQGGGEVSVVKLVQVDPLPVVQVEVNSGASTNFLIDTGGPEVIIDPDYAFTLGVKTQGGEKGTFAGGNQGDLRFAKLDSLEVGSFKIKNIPVEVLPTKQFAAIDGGAPIQGVIGTVLLYHFLSTIDYPDSQLILRKSDLKTHEVFVNEASTKKSISIPFWLAGDHYMVAWGAVDNTAPQLFLCDTGLAGLAFTAPDSTLKMAGISPALDKSQIGQGGGGGFSAAPIIIPKLTFGDAEEHNVDGVSDAFPSSLENALGFHLGGLVSHAFFRRYAVTFDFTGMRIFLSQPHP